MFQDVIYLLQNLGLKQNDAKVFVTCLHFKEGLFVHEIVKETKLKRSSVDLIIERLLAQGFLTKVKIGARYKYLAENPETLLFKQEQLLEDFKSLVPVLSKLGSTSSETEIKFYEGVEGLRQIYRDMFLKLKFASDSKRELLTVSHGAEMMRAIPDIYKVFIDKRIEESVPIRILAPQNASDVRGWENDPVELRSVKYFDSQQFPFDSNFEIYADSITISSLKKPIGGIVLTNPRIAESMRSLFNLLWSLL